MSSIINPRIPHLVATFVTDILTKSIVFPKNLIIFLSSYSMQPLKNRGNEFLTVLDQIPIDVFNLKL